MPEQDQLVKRRHGETLKEYEKRKKVIAEAKRTARESGYELHIYECSPHNKRVDAK
jgi:hypothetical protein